jgi:hypothetical protein
MVKVFGWRPEAFERTVNGLVADRILAVDVEVEGNSHPHLALRSLLDGK